MSEQHGSHDGPTRADGAVAVRGGSIEPVLSERDLTLLRCLAAGGSTVDVAAILWVTLLEEREPRPHELLVGVVGQPGST